MFDFGWDELLLIGVLALILLGPEELPRVVRSISHFIKGLRGYASDFVDQMNRIADVHEIQELKEEIKETGFDLLHDELPAPKKQKPKEALKGDAGSPPKDEDPAS